MSDFFNPHENRTARKDHHCTYCSELIPKGEEYIYQKGNWDGHWFESKMHPECFDDMVDSEDDEYTPYSNERPTKQFAICK